MSDDGGIFTDWRQKVISALVLLLVVALGARIVTELLAPLVPLLVAVLVLGFIGWAVFGRRK
jgi:hypothetical protein